MKKVLWISRHEINEAQKASLIEMIGECEILAMNLTLPGGGIEGAEALEILACKHQAKIAGVFPAHIVAAFVSLRGNKSVILPVSVPAHAREGEVRGGGFVFSHWEEYFQAD